MAPTFARPARLAAFLLCAAPGLALAKGGSSAEGGKMSGPRSVIVFVGAEDRGAENAALRLGQLVEDSLSRNDKYQLSSLSEAAGERVPGDARAAKHNAEDELAAGKKAFEGGKLDDAETSLKNAIKIYETGAAGLSKVDDYADANAYLAAVYQLKKKDDDAKDAIGEALAVKPSYKPDAKLSSGPFADLFKVGKREALEGHKGSASVFSTPSGGKVFIDGELKGYTPLTVDRIPVGKHLFRLERPGYYNYGQAADISSTDEVAIKGHFTATKEFAEVEDQVGQALKEVDSSAAGPSAFKLLNHFKVDRGIFANVRTSGDNLVLDLALVDAHSKKRVAHRRNSFEGEDTNNLSREVAKLTAGLLADADDAPRTKASSGRDPLDSVSGEEDWDEDKGAKKQHHGDDDEDAPKKKKHSGDDE